MSKPKNILLLLIIIAVLVCIKIFVAGSFVGMIFPEPPKADYGDQVVVDIGEDNFLVATIDDACIISEENISDSGIETADGTLNWYGAKNITYVTTFENTDYMIVWKAPPEKYDWAEDKNVNQYISTYALNGDALCFVEYSYENKCVYGIILGTENIMRTEYSLMFKILNLDESAYDMQYSSNGVSFSPESGDGGYHTVVPDRYTLSRSDPGAYYDHYEYGDNYAIDDYLESQGFD